MGGPFLIYSRSWYGRYPGAWRARRWAYGDAWAWAPWASLYGWFGYNAWDPLPNLDVKYSSQVLGGQTRGVQIG